MRGGAGEIICKETAMNEQLPRFAACWPRGARALARQPLAPRLDTLAGKTIAFLWDYLFRGDEVFEILKEGLDARFSGLSFIGPDTFGSTHGEDEQAVLDGLPSRLKALKVDTVLSGMGC